MPRPSLANDKRRELIPVIARAFADLWYRRTTTAELAKRCKVQENILYRLWPDKKAMFIATISYVYELAERTWAGLLDRDGSGSSAERVLDYESRHLGEFGHSRIIFAGLSETDDPEVRRALARMYQRYQRFVVEQVASHRDGRSHGKEADRALTAWALIGLGTVASIALEMKLLGSRDRRRLMKEMGRLLLDGRVS
ncbi:MAG: TetR/AcrR family transcriptional regulator [Phycisphaerae bacterium]|nr:TetR/AcrR family transcriptional regulator [Phycisphaerae bacterium]